MAKQSSGTSHRPSTRDKPEPRVRLLEECRGTASGLSPSHSKQPPWLQASTGTSGATAPHPGNKKPSSLGGAIQSSGTGSFRDLLLPASRGWVGRELPKLASPTTGPHSEPREPQRMNQEAAECVGKKLANYLNSLGLSFLICKMGALLPVLYRAVVVITGKIVFGLLSDI